MSKNIINLDDHRKKPMSKMDAQAYMEQMSAIEDTIEQMDELGVTTRDELVAMLEEMEASAPDTVE